MVFVHDEHFQERRRAAYAANRKALKSVLDENREKILADRKAGMTVMELAYKYLKKYDITQMGVMERFIDQQKSLRVSRRYG